MTHSFEFECSRGSDGRKDEGEAQLNGWSRLRYGQAHFGRLAPLAGPDIVIAL